MYILKKNKVYDLNGKRIKSKDIYNKIKKIYVPPAYKHVVYYLEKDLLAVGTDSKGRKQYIYSQKHKDSRHSKRSRIISKVNKCMPKLLTKIMHDLRSSDPDVQQCSVIIHLILLCNFRIGTGLYAKEYKHYGITTLKPKHLKFTPTKIHISFIGKKGISNTSYVDNRKIIKILKKLYKQNKKDGRIFTVTSSMVNEYLNNFKITCKELRTWNANKIYIELLTKNSKDPKPKELLKLVAQQLHNTPTVCKNSYLLKGILDDSYTHKIIQKKSKSVYHILDSLC
jgi:DNA topoisomerase-1